MTRYNLVLFWFMNDWGLYGRTYEMIARSMAASPHVGRVVCILPPKMIWDGYYLFPFHLRRETRGLYLLTPNFRMVPKSLLSAAMWRSVNESFRDEVIRRTLTALGCSRDNTVLWLFPPHKYIDRILDRFPYKMLITQIIDNHLHKANESPGMKSFAEKQYSELSRHSDLVFTSSRQNLELFSRVNRNCHFIENAVDRIFINRPSEMPYRKEGRRPRLGYVGWVTQRTDLELLKFVARERPGYDLLIAGPRENGVGIEESDLSRLPNVRLLGPMPYLSVPGFLDSVDVCLIPHRDTPYSRTMNPLKIFQYLGSGRPIVSTPVAGVERWAGLISVAGEYTEFARKIDEVIRNDSESESARRIDAVRGDTWEARIGQIHDLISARL